jgi:hypothetical protein
MRLGCAGWGVGRQARNLARNGFSVARKAPEVRAREFCGGERGSAPLQRALTRTAHHDHLRWIPRRHLAARTAGLGAAQRHRPRRLPLARGLLPAVRQPIGHLPPMEFKRQRQLPKSLLLSGIG